MASTRVLDFTDNIEVSFEVVYIDVHIYIYIYNI